MTENR